MPFRFDNTYARFPSHFYARVRPTTVDAPSWLAVNEALGQALGLDGAELRSDAMLATFAGNRIPEGAEPIALAYAGHQFGGFVPQLGDGRAILLGEAVDAAGKHWDVQLKGSGPTPYSRAGDGRAALGPVLREFVVSEAMHALGVPTTRSLAAVRTGEFVYRESRLDGAVLTRIASSHLRVGTFEFFARRNDRGAVEMLVDHALARHYPHREVGDSKAIALVDAVMDAQIRLVAQWLGLGFVHGVMNTDNCAISGETLDYGPCAFLDVYDPGRTFSSIDHGGRYAFANQPRIVLWNLARLAETLLPLVSDETPKAVAAMEARLERFGPAFEQAYTDVLRKKLGLAEAHDGDLDLARDLLRLMAGNKVDHTLGLRRLCAVAEGGQDLLTPMFENEQGITAWLTAWRSRIAAEGSSVSPTERAARMRQSNPMFIPRNHRIEEMIDAATEGDLAPFERLRDVLRRPYDDQPENADLAEPPGDEQWRYRTFCGT